MKSMNPSLLERSEKKLHRNGVPAEHQWRLSTASVLHWLSVIWTVPAFFVSAWTALYALAASPDDSEWGRYGAGGGTIGLIWCGAIAVLVLALILSVSAFRLMQSGSTSSSTRKGRLRWLGILLTLTVTNVVLWCLAYGSELAVFCLSPRGVSEIFGWLVEAGGSDFGMEAFTCLAITVGAAIILAALNARKTSCPGPPTEALGVSGKSRLVTSLFALFLGLIGAHRFYVGKRRTASLMLGLAIAGFPSLWLLSNIPYMTWIWHVTQSLAWIPALLIGWIPFFGWIALLFYSPFFVAVFVWSLVDFGMAVSGNMRDSRGKIIKRW